MEHKIRISRHFLIDALPAVPLSPHQTNDSHLSSFFFLNTLLIFFFFFFENNPLSTNTCHFGPPAVPEDPDTLSITTRKWRGAARHGFSPSRREALSESRKLTDHGTITLIEPSLMERRIKTTGSRDKNVTTD